MAYDACAAANALAATTVADATAAASLAAAIAAMHATATYIVDVFVCSATYSYVASMDTAALW